MSEIYIRADANEEIGSGHIMRCLSIAEKMRALGNEVFFIVADERSEILIKERGFQIICLNSVWNDLENEIPVMIKIIKEKHINKILIDDYFITYTYLKEIGRYTDVYYLDDINSFIYPVKKVINYNIFAEDLNYIERYKEAGLDTEFLLGTRYVPLRSEFENITPRVFNGLNRILITSGGSDSLNVIGNILDRIIEEPVFESYEYYCVIGRYNINKDFLIKKYSKYTNIHLLYNISNMNYYMQMCDLCITAGGSTIYELCSCGTPSIMYSIADNQIPCAKKVSSLNLMPWCGDMRYGMNKCLDTIIDEIKKYEEPDYWNYISNRMQELIDGKGAQRIAEELI